MFLCGLGVDIWEVLRFRVKSVISWASTSGYGLTRLIQGPGGGGESQS